MNGTVAVINDKSQEVAKLRELLAGFREWRTKLTLAAYRKGVEAGLSQTQPANPYANRGTNNHLRGGNDPRQAWDEGLRDGGRIAELVSEPGKVFPPITYREAKIVGYDQ
jgi:hypothetical protein